VEASDWLNRLAASRHLQQGGEDVTPRIGMRDRPDRQHRVADDIGNKPPMLGDRTEQAS